MNKYIAGSISIGWSFCAVLSIMVSAWELAFAGCVLAILTAVIGENS